ncbi:promotilin isoform X1 [Callorhinus ursinus]|uniref:promotilin isoform X1 n=1 Tax=Callorhinus ursinus TaxID=34884 RepID=UPI003CD044A5
MVSRKAVVVLLLVHVAAMLASQTEAFVPIFTHSELQKIREKERNRGQKKSLVLQKRSEEVGPLDPLEPAEEDENQVIKLTAPVEIGMKMNSRQLEKYRAALEGLLSEVLLSTQNETQREREHKQGKWEREKQASRRAGSLMRGSIPGPWDHDLGRRQTLND